MLASWIVAVSAEYGPKARERIFRRMEALMDPTRPKVVHIRPRTQEKAVQEMRVQSAAYWRAIEPALRRLIELEG